MSPFLLLAATLLPARAPQATTGYTTVTVQELKTAYASGAYVLNVRTLAEFAEGHIEQAVNLPLDSVEARAGEVPAVLPILVICCSGSRSAQASATQKKAGKDVINVDGGMNDWVAAGSPVTCC